MRRELQRVIQAMAVECDDTYAMANSIEDMLEEIFDDHEAQLKKYIELGEKQALEFDRFFDAFGLKSENISIDDAINFFKAKDKEIERLNADIECAKNMMKGLMDGVIITHKIAISKSRSIVAMLFWEWRKYNSNFKNEENSFIQGRASKTKELFYKAHKMLKEKQ